MAVAQRWMAMLVLLMLCITGQAMRTARAEGESARRSKTRDSSLEDDSGAAGAGSNRASTAVNGSASAPGLRCLTGMARSLAKTYKVAKPETKSAAMQVMGMGSLGFAYAMSKQDSVSEGIKWGAWPAIGKGVYLSSQTGAAAAYLLLPARAMADAAYGDGKDGLRKLAAAIAGIHMSLLLDMPVFQRTLMKYCPSPTLRGLAVGAVIYAACISGGKGFMHVVGQATKNLEQATSHLEGEPPRSPQPAEALPEAEPPSGKLYMTIESIKRWIMEPENEKVIEAYLLSLVQFTNEDYPGCGDLAAACELRHEDSTK